MGNGAVAPAMGGDETLQGPVGGQAAAGSGLDGRALRGAFCVQALKPPSTVTVVPVICRAAGLARKATAAAISAGVP